MTSRDFCYWLQGYFELSEGGRFTAEQANTVKKHLEMVFRHEIDPGFGKDKAALQEIHDQGGTGAESVSQQHSPGCSHDIKYTC